MTGTRPDRATSLHEVVDRHRRTLAEAGVASPDHDAIALTRHVLGLSTAGIRTAPMPDQGTCARLEDLVRRRAGREPLQLITGAAWFRFLRLECRPGVFVPRPETEVVAGHAIDAARLAPAPALVVDACTGTGAIALSVTAEVPHAQVLAIDADPTATALARRNLEHLRAGRADVRGPAAGATCRVLDGDLLEPLAEELRGRIDVLVSNPPYLPEDERDRLPPEVMHHDPDGALFGGADGREVVLRLIELAVTWLRPGGSLVLEIDERRGAETAGLAISRGLVDVRVERDLTGADRVVVAHRPRGHGLAEADRG